MATRSKVTPDNYATLLKKGTKVYANGTTVIKDGKETSAKVVTTVDGHTYLGNAKAVSRASEDSGGRYYLKLDYDKPRWVLLASVEVDATSDGKETESGLPKEKVEKLTTALIKKDNKTKFRLAVVTALLENTNDEALRSKVDKKAVAVIRRIEKRNQTLSDNLKLKEETGWTDKLKKWVGISGFQETMGWIPAAMAALRLAAPYILTGGKYLFYAFMATEAFTILKTWILPNVEGALLDEKTAKGLIAELKDSGVKLTQEQETALRKRMEEEFGETRKDQKQKDEDEKPTTIEQTTGLIKTAVVATIVIVGGKMLIDSQKGGKR